MYKIQRCAEDALYIKKNWRMITRKLIRKDGETR